MQRCQHCQRLFLSADVIRASCVMTMDFSPCPSLLNFFRQFEFLPRVIQGAGAAWAAHLEENGNITLEVQVTLGLNISTAAGSSVSTMPSRNGVWSRGVNEGHSVSVRPSP